MSTFQELLEKMGLKGHKENTEALGFSERMKKMFHMKEKFAEIPEKEVLTEILQSDMENIRGTMESLDKDTFSMAAELIQNAKKIYIVGIRSCEPLADFLGFYLNMLFDEVHVVRTNSASEIFEQLMRIGAGDVLIGISFPKYSMQDREGHGAGQQPERRGDFHYRQHSFAAESLFFLQPHCKKRDGVSGGLPDGSVERDQCADRGSLPQESGFLKAVHRNSGSAL